MTVVGHIYLNTAAFEAFEDESELQMRATYLPGGIPELSLLSKEHHWVGYTCQGQVTNLLSQQYRLVDEVNKRL